PLQLAGLAVVDGVEGGGGLLQVGPVATVRTGDDPVLAGLGALDELDGLGAAHGAGGGFDVDGGEPEAVEDALVGLTVLLEADVETGPVDVEGVGVLHRELPHPQQTRLGSGLVPEL